MSIIITVTIEKQQKSEKYEKIAFYILQISRVEIIYNKLNYVPFC